MSRFLLGAIVYINETMGKDSLTDEEKQKVKQYLANVKTFKTTTRHAKSRMSHLEDIEDGVKLIVKFAGFSEIEPIALKKLQELFMLQYMNAGRQFATVERRKKDGLEIPYKSPLEWTMKQQGVQRVLDLKTWYDETYYARYEAMKAELNDGKDERLRECCEPTTSNY